MEISLLKDPRDIVCLPVLPSLVFTHKAEVSIAKVNSY